MSPLSAHRNQTIISRRYLIEFSHKRPACKDAESTNTVSRVSIEIPAPVTSDGDRAGCDLSVWLAMHAVSDRGSGCLQEGPKQARSSTLHAANAR